MRSFRWVLKLLVQFIFRKTAFNSRIRARAPEAAPTSHILEALHAKWFIPKQAFPPVSVDNNNLSNELIVVMSRITQFREMYSSGMTLWKIPR